MRKFEAIRTVIKELSEEQKIVKPQRKQVYFEGTRTVTNPVQIARNNKYELRHLFQAYAILKGIERPEIRNKDVSESKVQELVKKYEPVE